MQQGQPGGQNRTSRNVIQCDCLYFITWPAIIKIVQVISSLIGFCCSQQAVFITGCGGCIEWFKIAAMSGLLLSSVFLVFYFLHVVEQFDNIPWLKIEVISSITWTIFDLSAALKLAISLNLVNYSISSGYGRVAAATAFGFFATAAYACDAGFQLFRMLKRIPAQDSRR